MKEIKLTQGRVTIVDDEDFDNLNQFKWQYHAGYACRGVKIDRKVKKIYMHTVIMNTPKGFQVDHANGDRLDNRRGNLRICTQAQNLQNRKTKSQSGYKGVYRFNKKWRATIKVKGKHFHVGMFFSPEDAARAYDEKAKEVFGEFAKPNFP